jgi:zinc protease
MGSMTTGAETVQDPPRGELVLTTTEPAIVVHHDLESEDTSVLYQRTMPTQRPADTVAHRRDELVRALGEAVLARRLRALIEQDPASPLQSASAFSYFWCGFDHAGMQGTAKPGRALDGLQLIITEYRRMADYGPTAAELTIERGSYASQLETAVAQAGVRTNPQLAQALYTSAFTGETLLSPKQEQELLQPMLAGITTIDVVESLRAYRSRPGRDVAGVAGREDLGSGAEPRVASAVRAALSAVITRPVEKVAAVWGYPTDFEHQQASGFWQQDQAGADSQGVSAQSRKGLRIQTRPSTSQPNQIIIIVRLESGITPRAAGVAELIERGFFAGGLGKHTADEVSTLFADSSVKLGGITVGEDGVTVSASCTPADFQRALERLAAHLTDPGWRSEAEARTKQAWDEELAAVATDIEATTERTLQALLVADDPARRQATRAEAAAVTFVQARAWLDPILAKAPLTVTIAGDLAEAKGYPDIVFAALGAGRDDFPMVATTGDAWRSRLARGPAAPVGRNQVAVTAQVAKALVRVVWPTDDMYDIRQTRRLNLLANCLSERLRITIREQLGAAYSPAAWHVASEAYRGSGGIHASIGVSPEQADTVATLALDLADRLAAEGIDTALLDQVKIPVVKGLAARLQRNDWWAGVVMPRLATQPFRLTWAGQIEADFAAVTPNELSVLASKYLVRAKALTVIGTARK